MTWAVDVLLQPVDDSVGDSPNPLRKEALECIAYVRDILNKGKVPKVLEEDRLFRDSERKRRPEAEAENQTKEQNEAAHERDAHPRADTSFSTRSSSAPLPSIVFPGPPSLINAPPLAQPPTSTTSRPTPYLSTRDSTPASSLSRTPYVSPSYLSSTAPNGARHSSPPMSPWHSTPSAFSGADATATLRKPLPISNCPNISPGDARRTNQTQADSLAIPTYQSDPLRG